MKIKSILLAALAVAAFASCSKDDKGGKVNTEPVDVFLRMTQGTTRADSKELVEDGKELNFTSGYLFFTDGPTSSANILRAVRITTNSIAGTVTPGQLEAGTVIYSVHNDASNVWVFGNVPEKDASGVTIPDLTIGASTIADVESILIDILSQGELDSDGLGVETASLYGMGTIDRNLGGTHNGEDYDATAKFDVAPIISRIEIEKIEADNSSVDPADAIDGYKLVGIYINEYYFAVGPNAGVSASTLINNLQDIPSYASTTNGGVYDDEWAGYLFDEVGKSTSFGDTDITPDNDVWAYNVFATMAVPHVVFHFENMTINGTPRPNPVYDALPGNTSGDGDGICYLTVTGYTRTNGGGQVAMEGGKVYRMSNVAFTAEDLGNTPEPNTKFSCLVDITLLPWEVIEVDPSFD